jgi:hypothetical protein
MSSKFISWEALPILSIINANTDCSNSHGVPEYPSTFHDAFAMLSKGRPRETLLVEWLWVQPASYMSASSLARPPCNFNVASSATL